MRRSSSSLCLALFSALGVLIGFITLQPGGPVELFERGHWLGPASDMLVGKIPFRDTFPVHGFLADGGFDLFLFKLFGPSFKLSLYAHHFLGAFFQATLFLVTAAATRSWLIAALTIPINLSFTTGLVADRSVLPLLSLAAFLWALGATPKPGRALAAGLLGGLGLLYALDFGTFVLLAELCGLGLAIWRSSRRRSPPMLDAKAFLAGVALPVVAFCGYFASHNALGDFLRTSFVDLPLHIGEVWGWPFPQPWDLLRAWLHGRQYAYDSLVVGVGLAKRLYLAPVMGVIGIATSLAFRRHSSQAVLRLAVLSVACLLFFRHSIDRLHLEVGNALTGPTFTVVVYMVSQYARVRDGRNRRLLRAGLAALAVCAALVMNLPGRIMTIVSG